MIYEQRRTIVHAGTVPDYIRHCRENVWPSLGSHDGKVIGMFAGLIGDPPNELMQVTVFPDMAAWQSAQAHADNGREPYVTEERVRLLRSVSSRPKSPIPNEDRRSVYGHRRFFISPGDLDEFVHCSENGIWPRIEAQGACILGLWTTLAATTPQEVVLLTGYHGPTNWEETRQERPKPDDMDQELWDHSLKLRNRRTEMTQRTWVRLMRAIEL